MKKGILGLMAVAALALGANSAYAQASGTSAPRPKAPVIAKKKAPPIIAKGKRGRVVPFPGKKAASARTSTAVVSGWGWGCDRYDPRTCKWTGIGGIFKCGKVYCNFAD